MSNKELKNKKAAIWGILLLLLFIVGIIIFNYIQYLKPLDTPLVIDEETETEETSEPIVVVDEKTDELNSQETNNLSKTVLEYQQTYDNPEIIGRLYIPGTIIDYPIVQKKEDTNNIYYLKRNYYEEYDENGSIYLDFENDFENDDKNTIIYGHNMAENLMFHSIRYFRNDDFFNKNLFTYVETLTETRIYKNIAWMETKIDFDYIKVNFANDDEYYELQQGIVERSVHPLDFQLDSDNYILSLSTCDNDTSNDDYRFVLTSVLINKIPMGDPIPYYN